MTKIISICYVIICIMETAEKQEYVRVGFTIPKQSLQELDKYCGKLKIRSAVIRQALEEFLDKHKEKPGSS